MRSAVVVLLVLLVVLLGLGIAAQVSMRSEVGALRQNVDRLSGTLERLDQALQRIMEQIPMSGPGVQEFSWFYDNDGTPTKKTLTVTRGASESAADFKARGLRELAAEQQTYPPI